MLLDTLVRNAPEELTLALALAEARDLLNRSIRSDTLRAERQAEEAAWKQRRALEQELHDRKVSESRKQKLAEWRALTPEQRAARKKKQEEDKAQRQHDRHADRAARAEAQRVSAEREEYYRSGQAVRDASEKLIESIRSEAFIEWTAELLSSEFTMSDGSHVTWGSATVEQHRARKDMHSANARAGIEGAVRHSQAIVAITTGKATCLNELVAA